MEEEASGRIVVMSEMVRRPEPLADRAGLPCTELLDRPGLASEPARTGRSCTCTRSDPER